MGCFVACVFDAKLHDSESSCPIDFKYSGLMPVGTKKLVQIFVAKRQVQKLNTMIKPTTDCT